MDQQIPSWQTNPAYPITFSAQFTSASYDNPNAFDMTALNANLNMLYDSGASAIRIDVGYDAWLTSNQARIGMIDDLVGNISSSGRQFILADAGAESYRNNPVPWSTFQSDWVQRVRTLASALHPDYYIVIKEPGWYVPMVSDATTNPQFQNATAWVALADQLASTVHDVSPNTVVGVSIAASDMSSEQQFYDSFLTGVENNQEIGFIGFDIYNIPGFTNTQTFLMQYGNGGKDIWIAEAWSGSGKVAVDQTRQSLDQLWMSGIYDYAMTIHADLINPFFTNLFSSYQSAPTNSQDAVSFYSGRTPVFDTFQSLVTANAALNSSSSSESTSLGTGRSSSGSTQVQSSSSAGIGSSSQSSQGSSNSSQGTGGSTRSGNAGALDSLMVVPMAVAAIVIASLVSFGLRSKNRRPYAAGR